MLQIRRSIFETNSSSSHSVSVCKQGLEPNKMPIDPMDNLIHVSLGDFDWEWKKYPEQIDKLSYLVTMLMELKKIKLWRCDNDKERRIKLDELMGTREFKRLSNAIAKYADCDGVYIDTSEGYIDHQSYEDYGSLRGFIDSNGVKSVKEFIFDPGIIVKTGNDNEARPHWWREI